MAPMHVGSLGRPVHWITICASILGFNERGRIDDLDLELIQSLSVLYLVYRSGHGIRTQPIDYRTSILQG